MSDAPSPNAAILRRWARTAGPWVVVALALAWWGSRLEGPLSSGSAPPLRVTLKDGSPFDLGAQAGQVVVLNFWAAWCPPCRAEASALSRVHHAVQGHGARLVGLAVDAISLSRAERLGMDYPVALASEEVLERFGVQTLPTTVVVDPHGHIAHSFVGAIDEATLRDAIDDAASDDR